MKEENTQAWTLNSLANSYSISGQPRRAVLLLEMANEIDEKQGDKKNVAIGLVNLALAQIPIGELDTAESNIRRSIEICRVIKDKFWEASGHHELSQILIYRGKSKESEQESSASMNLLDESSIQSRGTIFANRSICSRFMSNTEKALEYARKARELAGVKHFEKDVIRAEYLLGSAYFMKGNLTEAEKHLNEALTRDRKNKSCEFGT